MYSKWDRNDKSEAETRTEHDTGAESTAKPVDGVGTKAGDSKGKKAAEAAKEGEPTLPDDRFMNRTPGKDTDLVSQDKGGEPLAADWGETPLSSSCNR